MTPHYFQESLSHIQYMHYQDYRNCVFNTFFGNLITLFDSKIDKKALGMAAIVHEYSK